MVSCACHQKMRAAREITRRKEKMHQSTNEKYLLFVYKLVKLRKKTKKGSKINEFGGRKKRHTFLEAFFAE